MLGLCPISKQGRRKLDNRATDCIFVEYSSQTRGYRFGLEDKLRMDTQEYNDTDNYRYNKVWSEENELKTADEDFVILENDV